MAITKANKHAPMEKLNCRSALKLNETVTHRKTPAIKSSGMSYYQQMLASISQREGLTRSTYARAQSEWSEQGEPSRSSVLSDETRPVNSAIQRSSTVDSNITVHRPSTSGLIFSGARSQGTAVKQKPKIRIPRDVPRQFYLDGKLVNSVPLLDV